MLVPFFRFFFKPEFIGRENIPKTGPCFIIGNHAHTFDGFMLNMAWDHEPTAGIITEEYFRGGFLSWALLKMGSVPTRKYQPQATPVRKIMRHIRDQRMFVVMPEGERNWNGITRPTVASTGKLFRRLGVPVHPVIIHNGYLAWPRWAHWPRRVPLIIEFLPPFTCTPQMSDAEVARLVDASVAWSPAQDRKLFPVAVRWAFRPADGITKLIFACPNCHADSGLEVRRGKHLDCTLCGHRWTVGGDSALTHRETGEVIPSEELFRRICQAPLSEHDFANGHTAIYHQPGLPVYLEQDTPQQRLLGKYDCYLGRDRVELQPAGKGQSITILFADLQTISIEKKYKLQLRVADGLYQINFDTGSAYQWEIAIRGMVPGVERMLIRRSNLVRFDEKLTAALELEENES